MTTEQLKTAFSKYKNFLEENLFTARRGDISKIQSISTYQHVDIKRHICWMCQESLRMVEDGKIEKAQRWLGFIQGVLWASGMMTIDQMKEDNRPLDQ